MIYRILLERGWVEHGGNGLNSQLQTPDQKDAWHLHWKNAKFSPAEYDFLLSWQVINHFPKTFNIAKKDCLARNLKRLHSFFFVEKLYVICGLCLN